MSKPDAAAVLESLSSHPHVEALAAHVLQAALQAAEARRPELRKAGTASSDTDESAPEPELSPEQATTELGDVGAILERGPEQPEEQMLLATLLALGIKEKLGEEEQPLTQLAGKIVWLATHTPVDALSAIDAALGEEADGLWQAAARVATDPGAVAPDLGRAEALVAAAALRSSTSEAAAQAAQQVTERTDDPVLRAVLVAPERELVTSLQGELQPAPHTPLRLVLLGCTGILFVLHLARLLGRLALAYRRPARLTVSPRGVELSYRTELLGRILRDRETVVPLGNLARVTREVRYPRLGLYAGLLALALGSYLGMGLLVDGVRVPGGSPPLLGMGILIIALGLALDFGLSSVADTVRGRCRVVVVPRKGKALCVGALDPERADEMLLSIAEHGKAHAQAELALAHQAETKPTAEPASAKRTETQAES